MNCPSCGTGRLLTLLFLVAAVLGGCQGEPPEMTDPLAGYDAYGVSITAEDAVPALAVLAETDRYVDQAVKVEGIIGEVCQNMGCWLTIAAGPDQAPIRVDVPRDTAGAYVYTFPTDISGRRVIVSGMLRVGEDAEHEHGDHEMDGEDAEGDADDGHAEDGEHAEEEAMGLEVAIIAEGALVERIAS